MVQPSTEMATIAATIQNTMQSNNHHQQHHPVPTHSASNVRHQVSVAQPLPTMVPIPRKVSLGGHSLNSVGSSHCGSASSSCGSSNLTTTAAPQHHHHHHHHHQHR